MIKAIIIGAGPSALFTAKTILENSKTISVQIIEQGKTPSERVCPADNNQCQNCTNCATLEGVGGAGLFSDGKLVLDLTSGGEAGGITNLTDSERYALEENIRNTFINFDGVSEAKNKPSHETQNMLRSTLKEKNLEFKFYNVLHMGTQNLQNITTVFIDYLSTNFGGRFKIETKTVALDIYKDNFGYSLLTNKGLIHAEAIVTAVGKSGAQWLKKVLSSMGCTFVVHDFFFGFRMETQAQNIKNLVKYSFDPKIYRVDLGRKVKLHCVCRNGKIRYSRYRDILVVGGHSPCTKNNKNDSDSMNANFNVLLSFDKHSFDIDTLLSKFQSKNKNSIIAQKLSDFIENRRSVNFDTVIPSNPAMVCLGNFRSIIDSIDSEFSEIIIRFLHSLAELYPGVMDNDNILYAPAIEWDMDTVTVDKNMETEQKNLFAVGDGAGLSQGIVYAAATGIIAAKKIVARFEGEDI